MSPNEVGRLKTMEGSLREGRWRFVLAFLTQVYLLRLGYLAISSSAEVIFVCVYFSICAQFILMTQLWEHQQEMKKSKAEFLRLLIKQGLRRWEREQRKVTEQFGEVGQP